MNKDIVRVYLQIADTENVPSGFKPDPKNIVGYTLEGPWDDIEPVVRKVLFEIPSDFQIHIECEDPDGVAFLEELQEKSNGYRSQPSKYSFSRLSPFIFPRAEYKLQPHLKPTFKQSPRPESWISFGEYKEKDTLHETWLEPDYQPEIFPEYHVAEEESDIPLSIEMKLIPEFEGVDLGPEFSSHNGTLYASATWKKVGPTMMRLFDLCSSLDIGKGSKRFRNLVFESLNMYIPLEHQEALEQMIEITNNSRGEIIKDLSEIETMTLYEGGGAYFTIDLQRR